MEPLVILSIIIILVATFVFGFYIRARIITTVKHSSQALSQLANINSKTKYKKLEEKYFYSYNCMSRAEFNHFSLEDYFCEIIGDNESFYHRIITSIEHNKKEKEKYKRKLKSVDFSQSEIIAQTEKIPFALYNKHEKKLYNKMLLPNPITEITIVCRKEYTTPAGRTHTWSDEEYHYKELACFYEQAKKNKEQREIRKGQIEYERGLMTPSLRYEILRRDDFSCQLCGSTAKDGVKLHIDHIIPVSKGGHTTPENLRVLCDRCNLGKSDKIE
ncbi:MAG: HNH endonuclease [Clostridia bacterium]|nr:HNH endonuclease [Clostridia bacterium]